MFLSTKARQRHLDKCFAGFIGQQDAILQIKAFANTYFVTGESFSVLLAGPPSVGKTSMSKALAEALQVSFVNTDANVLTSNDAIAATMMETLIREKARIKFEKRTNTFQVPPLIYFIDEAQDLSKQGQSGLLRATERNDAVLLTKPGHVYDCQNVIWVCATTVPEALLKTLRSRFLTVECRSYVLEEVSEMVGHAFKKFPQDVCTRIIYYSGLSPRIAKGFAKRVSDLARLQKTDLLATIESVARMLQIDQWGMHAKTKTVLLTLHNHPEGLILRELAQNTGCEGKAVTDTYLPPLMQVTPHHGALVIHDDRYYITPEGELYLHQPWPIHL